MGTLRTLANNPTARDHAADPISWRTARIWRGRPYDRWHGPEGDRRATARPADPGARPRSDRAASSARRSTVRSTASARSPRPRRPPTSSCASSGQRRAGDPRGHREQRADRRRPGLRHQRRRPDHHGGRPSPPTSPGSPSSSAGWSPASPTSAVTTSPTRASATPSWRSCWARSRCTSWSGSSKLPSTPDGDRHGSGPRPDHRPRSSRRSSRPTSSRGSPASGWRPPSAGGSPSSAAWSAWVPTASRPGGRSLRRPRDAAASAVALVTRHLDGRPRGPGQPLRPRSRR